MLFSEKYDEYIKFPFIINFKDKEIKHSKNEKRLENLISY